MKFCVSSIFISGDAKLIFNLTQSKRFIRVAIFEKVQYLNILIYLQFVFRLVNQTCLLSNIYELTSVNSSVLSVPKMALMLRLKPINAIVAQINKAKFFETLCICCYKPVQLYCILHDIYFMNLRVERMATLIKIRYPSFDIDRKSKSKFDNTKR